MGNPVPFEKPWSATRLAAASGVTPSNISRHVRLGRIKAFRIPTGTRTQWRIPAEEARRFLVLMGIAP